MIKTFDHGLLGSNTYLYVTDADHAMIIDCGCDPKELLKYVEKNKITVDYVVLTHGHYDHIDFIGEYAQSFKNAEIICHREELPLISDPEGNLSCFFGFSKKYEENYKTVKEGDIISLPKKGGGRVEFSVIHAPGHTAGCICLYCEEEKTMFTGDVLFANGYGRVDLKYASPTDMGASLRRLYTYEGVTIYPGHGESATI